MTNKTKPTKRAILKDYLSRMDAYCPKCEFDVIMDDEHVMNISFCPDCGTKLKQPRLCIWCKNPVNATANFCAGCGMKV